MRMASSRVRPVRVAAVLVTALAVGACSITEKIEEKGRIDYKSAGKQRERSLDIPPDLASPGGGDRYAIPDAAQSTYSGYEREQQELRARTRENAPASAEPGEAIAGTSITHAGGTFRIEREGQQRWLTASLSAEQLWPLVREFWQQSGFIIDTESPETGIMETDWAENRAKLPQDFIRRTVGKVFDGLYSTGERDRFRTRLERRPDGGTDIYVTHRGMVEVYPDKTERDTTVWQPRPSDPELEVEFLRRLMVQLGADVEQADAAAAAARAQPAPQDRAGGLERGPDGHARLVIADDFERAWRRVGLALDRGGFAVEDRDRSRGVYFVRYIDPESDARRAKEGGFLSRMFGSSRREKKQTEVFQIRVEGDGERSTVRVLSRDGEAVPETDRVTASRMLALIQEQLRS